MSTVSLSEALGAWMREQGATTIEIELQTSADGDDVWSAAVVYDDHRPQRHIKVFETSDEYPMCWQPLVELARNCTPIQNLPDVDWGRLA